MRTLLKPLGIAAMALALVTTAATDAEAGRRHRNNAGKFIAGLATGIIAGAIISNATRPRHHGNNYYYSSYDEPQCYRGAPQCHSRWDCWVNSWGREVCERVERCHRPLICE